MELHTGISDIRLSTTELYIHVEVQTAGVWYEVIRELRSNASIDHFITAGGIRQLYLDAKQGKPQDSPSDTYTTTEALAVLSVRAGRPVTDKLLRRFVADGLLTLMQPGAKGRHRRFRKSEVESLDIQAHFERVRQAHHALANRSFSALARRHEVRIAEHRANGPQTGLPHNSA